MYEINQLKLFHFDIRTCIQLKFCFKFKLSIYDFAYVLYVHMYVCIYNFETDFHNSVS